MTYEEFTKEYAQFLKDEATKSNPPSWFVYNLKSLLSKQITIEDWNQMQKYLRNNASDIETINEFLESVAKSIKQLLDTAVTKDLLSTSPTPDTIALRDSSGQVHTATPTENDDSAAVPFHYLISKLLEKVDIVSVEDHPGTVVYARDGEGNPTYPNLRSTIEYGGYNIVYRDGDGRAEIEDPITAKQIINKGAVESYVTEKLLTKADLVDGKVPASQLPSYVDDVIEVLKICSTSAELPTASKDNVGAQCICINPSIDPDDIQSLNLLLPIQWARGAICEVVDTESTSGNRYRWFYKEDLRTGAVYVTTEDNKTYRYTVSNNQGTMVIIGTDLALGETSSTAYAGDKGKANRDDINSIIDGGIKVYSAVRDQAGNIIDETYATNEAVDGKVDRVETSSIDGVYGLKAENSVEPFQTDSIYNPTSQLTPSTCGKYVIRYKTIIGLVSNGYGLTGLTYNVTESSFTVTNASGSAQVAFRFNTSAGKTYTLRNITLQSTYCAIQYFTSDGTRLGNTSSLYSGNQFTVPTYDQEVAYGMITIAPTSGGNLTINKLEVVELNATTTDTLFPVTELQTAGTIPLRDANGCIRVASPKTSNDAVNLAYLTSVANGKLDKHAGFAQHYALYGVESDGTQSMFPIYTDATPYGIPQLNANGQLSSATPTDDTHVANKAYVDNIANIAEQTIQAMQMVMLMDNKESENNIVYGAETHNLIEPFQKDNVYRVTTTGTVTSNGLLVSQYKTILGIDENGLGVIMNSYNITSNSISVVSNNNKEPTMAFRFDATKGVTYNVNYNSEGATEVVYVLFYSKTGTYLDRLANTIENGGSFTVPSALTENDVYGLIVFRGTDNDTLTITKLVVANSLYGTDNLSTHAEYDLSESLVGKTIPMRTEEGNILVATPTADLHATTKKYVDDAIASAITAAINANY